MKLFIYGILVAMLFFAGSATAQNYNISNSSISTCTGNFYDSGGGGGSYGNNESYIMTFCSSVAGECIRLNFSAFDLESGFDFVTVYNGPNTASPVLGTFTGTGIPPVLTATTGCLTIEFTSDFIITGDGWAAIISCVACPGSACPSCNGGAPPANDPCSGAQNLGALPMPAACPNGIGTWANFNTTNLCATAESPYTTLIGCQPSGNMASPASDVWYRFTITGPTLNIQINGMQTPNIGLYAGTNCSNLVGRGCAIGGGGVLNTSFGGLAPGTYFLQVSGGNLNDQCSFTLSLQNNYDCQGCVIQSSFTASPPPVNGTYQPGQTVTFCYTITDYNQTSANWLHAITPSFGAGWDISTLTTNPANDCSGAGTWSWYNNLITSTATGLVTGPGFYYESNLGSPSGVADGNPGNNYGDNNPGNGCDWTFCWTITAANPAVCVPGTSLNISVDTYGDGESGSWTSLACVGDPVADFFATVTCCEPPVVAITNPPCVGMNTGSVIASGQGTGPWDYTWRNNAGTIIQSAVNINGTNSISNLAPGNYTVTTLDNTGCTATVNFTITTPPALVINIVPVAATCNGAATGSATANVVGGTGAYQYNWSPSGGALASASGLTAGTYTVTVTDDNGCTNSAQSVITEPTPLVINTLPVNAACGQSNGSVTINVVGGSGALQYSITGGANFQAANNFLNLAAGNYNVVVTDANGCTGTTLTVINNSIPPVITSSPVTDVLCNGGNTGSITINANGGTGVLQYSNDNGTTFQPGNVFNNLPAGNYNLVVNDANGCQVTSNVVINEPPVVTANVAGTDPVCGQNNGTITATGGGGTGIYQYNINGGPLQAGVTFSNLGTGNYTVTVTDGNGCTGDAVITLNTAPPLVLNTNITSAACGNNNGSITVGANGGTVNYSFSIDGSPFQPASVFNNLLPGNYTIVVQDANGCTTSVVVAVPDQPGPSIAATSFTDVLCNSASDGTATVNANGGTAPLQYSLNGGAYQPSGLFIGLAAGNYSVFVSDVNGCTISTNIVIAEPPVLQGAGSSVNSTCNNSNGSVTVNANGGTGVYQFSLNGGAPQPSGTFNNLAAGNYIITVTDVNGCTVAVVITVADDPAPVITDAPATLVNCNGGSDGTITVNAVGGTGALQYSIDNGTTYQAGNTFSNLTAGNYTVLISDANGCTSTINSVVTEPAPVSAVTATTGSTCGNANGDVAITANGGTGAFQYSINGGAQQASNTFAALAAGNYSYTVTDANGCTFTDNFSITNAPGPVISNTATTLVSCFGGNDGTLDVTINGGTAPVQYSLNGGAQQLTGSFGSLAAGNYTVMVSDVNGCTISTNIVIAEPPVLQSAGSSVNSTCSNSNGSVTVNANGGTGVYQFSLNGGAQQPSGTFNNLATGNYTITVTDVNGCTVAVVIAVADEPAPVITDAPATLVDCNGGSDGAITVNAVGGTGVLQYSIDNGTTYQAGNTFINLSAGNYTVQIADDNGCTATFNTTVSEPAAVSGNVITTQASCGNSDGTATASGSGGTLPHQFSIDNGTTYQASGIFNNLAAGNYTIILMDANGCTTTINTSVNNSAAPVVLSAPVTDLSCFNSNDGTIIINSNGGTAPLNFSIDNGSTFQLLNTFNNLPGGNYNIVVEDALGCQATINVVINEPSLLDFNSQSVNTTCGQSNGSITITANGGTTNYSYSNNGGTSQQQSNTFNNVSAGNYSVVVTDANGCTAIANLIINDAAGPAIQSTTITDIDCNGAGNGQIAIIVNGGTPPIQYSIDNGTSYQTSSSFPNLAPGNYVIIVADANGCTTSSAVTINQPAAIVINSNSTSASCGNSDGSLTISVNGGTGILEYSIDNGSTFQLLNVFNNITAGSYTILVQDANGCTETATGVVNNTAAPSITASAFTDVNCFGADNGSITITASGGTGTIQYSNDNGNTFQSTNIFNNLSPGNYDIIIEDINGCQAATTITITEPAELLIGIVETGTTCGQSNGSITVNANGGTGIYSYSNDGGASQQAGNIFNGILSGNYVIMVTDANGCSTSQNVIVPDAPGPVIQNITVTNITCFGAADGELSITANGGTGSLQYSIDNGNTQQASITFTGLTPGNYDVIVTDANGCSIVLAAIILEPAEITFVTNNTPASCGNSDGTLTVVANGGTGSYEYSIDNGITFQSSPNLTGLIAGNYTIIVQDVNGCTASGATAVSNAAAPAITATAFTDVTCFGNNNGTITITANGGTGILQYSIDNGITFQTGNVFNNLSPGNYNIIAEDVNGCQATSTLTITEPQQLTASIAIIHTTCSANNGSYTVTPSGGTGPYQFSHNGSAYQQTTSFNSLVAGNYTVTIQDANGCTADYPVLLNDAPGPVIQSVNATNITCNGADDGTITVTATSGTAPLEFSIDNGISSQTATLFNNLAGGNYTILVTDANGCTINSLVAIVEPNAINPSYSATTASCGNADGTITMNASGGSGALEYSIDNGVSFQSSVNFITLPAGTYTIIIQDANGCTTSLIAAVNNAAAPSIQTTNYSDITCNGDDDGSITIAATGGTGALTYSIDNGATIQSGNSFNNLTSGIYNIVVSDINGCSATSQVTIFEPALLTATASAQTSTCGNANGTLSINAQGGTGTLQFSLDGGTTFQPAAAFNNLLQGNYTILVSDANGCTYTLNSVVPAAATPVISAIFSNNLTCFGSNDGLITIVVNGGTQPLQYSIDNGVTFSSSMTFASLSQGNYSIVVADANGCTATSSQNLVQPTLITFSTAIVDANCGNNDGSIVVTANGGSGNYTYSADNGASFQPSNTFNSLAAGSYAIVVRDAVDCTSSAPATVSNVAAPVIQSNPVTNVSCNGQQNGTLTINVNGGTVPLSYSIDGGFTWQSSNSFTNLAPGTFNIVVSDANSCDAISSATITQPAAINLNATTTTATCGNNDGTLSINAAGGNGNLNYSMSGGPVQPTGNFNNLAAGNYSIVVTDASGCSTDIVASVSNTNAPVIASVNITAISCYGVSDGTIIIIANGGTGNLTYSINNGTSSQGSGSYSNLPGGTYNILVEDASGCIATSSIILNEPDELILNTLAVPATCGTNNGEIQTLATGGTGSLLYSIDNGITTQPAGIFQGLSQGSYTVLITDANGCSTNAGTTITNIPGPEISGLNFTDNTCFGSDDGSVTIVLLGGTGPFQYNLNGGTNQITNYFGSLSPGTYQVSVTDVNGCTVDSVLSITEPVEVILSSSVVHSTCSDDNGEISLTGSGGTGTLTFSNNGGLSFQSSGVFTGLLAGNYDIQVMDANGCIAIGAASINDAPSPQIQSTLPVDIACNGMDNGSIEITTMGGMLPLQYSIDNGVTFQPASIFNNLAPGVYNILVTDANGCTVTTTASLTEPAAILTSVANTATLCNGGNDGTATITVLGGITPYTYSWSNGATGQPVTGNLSAGTYTVTVTDGNGCSTSATTLITEPDSITVQGFTTNISCNGFTDGAILLATTGGTAPYIYSWNTMALAGHDNNNIAAGTYIVSITDANGCTSSQTYSITEPSAIILTASATAVSCFGDNNGIATVTANGGTGSYSYQWSNNTTSMNATSLVAGTYTVTVTDANGCTANATETITSPDSLSAITLSTPVTCYGAADGTASVAVSGGTLPYNYAWSIGGNTATLNNINGGTLTVNITDANNCVTTANVQVSEPAPILVSLTGAATLCMGQSAVISATAQGGNGGYTYTWTNGITGSSQTVSPVNTTSYNVTVTDSLGCLGSGTTLIVTVNPALSLTISQPDTICEGEQVQLTALASGGDGGPYTYYWSGLIPSTSQVTVAPAGTTTYMVTVTDGCGTPAALANVQIVVNLLPVVNFTPIPAEGCAPLLVFFENSTVTSLQGAFYEWNFGDNSNSTIYEPSHHYTEPGYYTVILKAISAEGCISEMTVIDAVKVYPVPSAAIGMNPPVASILHPEINFTDIGYGANWWNWDFGDNSALTSEQNPSHMYETTGNYTIALYVMNDFGCRDTAYTEIIVEGASTVYIPNAFSPNGDGRNDIFTVSGIGLTDMEMAIFNRWGNQIFISGDVQKGWNGSDLYSGTECPQGVYIYQVNVKNFKGELFTYTGRVTLVR
ncbi:MAG: PKD domain-containing protein [Bacteroidota bacterium]|nr:PKD domain-containing protein [Bacteroidota bacterium]